MVELVSLAIEGAHELWIARSGSTGMYVPEIAKLTSSTIRSLNNQIDCVNIRRNITIKGSLNAYAITQGPG